MIRCFDNGQRVSLTKKVGVIILGGGKGSRLHPLTNTRCKPVVSFGGRYRLIDVPVSQAIKSGYDNIFIIGQHLASTLEDHLKRKYFNNNNFLSNIHLLNPKNNEEYLGTADAVRKNIRELSKYNFDYFLILSGDQLYNLNFQDLVNKAIESDAELLIAAVPVQEQEASRMGLIKYNTQTDAIEDFVEKPSDTEVLNKFRIKGLSKDITKEYLASMGIYVFKSKVLESLLTNVNDIDFGKDIIPKQRQKINTTYIYKHDGYWEDVGTIGSYYNANIALTKNSMNFFERDTVVGKNYKVIDPILTNSVITDSLICEHTKINNSVISNSIIGIGSLIEDFTSITSSVLVASHKEQLKNHNVPRVGHGSQLNKTILCENATIGKNVKLFNNFGYNDFQSPSKDLFVRDGIIIVPEGVHIPDGYSF